MLYVGGVFVFDEVGTYDGEGDGGLFDALLGFGGGNHYIGQGVGLLSEGDAVRGGLRVQGEPFGAITEHADFGSLGSVDRDFQGDAAIGIGDSPTDGSGLLLVENADGGAGQRSLYVPDVEGVGDLLCA